MFLAFRECVVCHYWVFSAISCFLFICFNKVWLVIFAFIFSVIPFFYDVLIVFCPLCRKKRPRRRRDGPDSLAGTLSRWKEYNRQQDSKKDGRPKRKVPAKGSRKGCMRGKGGPENNRCNYRGVRQRVENRIEFNAE